GVRGRMAVAADGKSAVTIAVRDAPLETCFLSVTLRAPFTTKKLACVGTGEDLVDSALSPTGKYVAVTTQNRVGSDRAWGLRVVALPAGKVVLDEPDQPGLVVRAISDTGLLVRSGAAGFVVQDVPAKKKRTLDIDIDIGQRGFFRSGSELVYVAGREVAVL